GKTFQLKRSEELNGDNVEFVELIGINDMEEIKSTTDIVLIDSIDEALLEVTSKKILKRKLVKYIENCQKINPEVKFIITCRFLEWKEIFEKELRNIDDSLKILEIKDLSKEDINKIIDFKEKDKEEFWEFIEKNSLSMLLKNILIVENIVLNYEIYKKEDLKYADIYKKIIKDHIFVETGNERKKIIKDYSGEKLEKLSSSISCYMSLNRMNLLPKTKLSNLANEIYRVKGHEIVGKYLDVLFDTSLFVGESKGLKFIHKSIQEHLIARFIIDKGLSMKKIKEIFGYNNGFYERFEEVIIHLTNIEPQFFRHFVDFDPFIFRRHPNLNEEEQNQLFVAIIKRLKIDGQELWGNWRNVRGTTLVKFDKVNDLFKYLEENIQINQVNRELFLYLEKILDENYSEELEMFLLEVLECRNKNKQDINEYLNGSWSENKSYNKKLLEFIKGQELLNREHDSLYRKIFGILYRHVNLEDLSILIEYVSSYSQKEIIKKLDKKDIKKWLEKVIENYKSDYRKLFVNLLYEFLSKYSTEEREIFKKILNFINEDNSIYIETRFYNKEKLDFSIIENDFFNFYFKPLSKGQRIYSRNKILKFYSIEVRNIEKIIKKYPISKYKEYYYSFSLDKKIESLLLEDKDYKAWSEERIKRAREQEKLDDKEYGILGEEQKRKNYKKEKEKNYKKALDSLDNINEVYYVYNVAFNMYPNDEEKLKEKLINDLGGKHSKFIKITKNYFENDILSLQLKKNILKNTFSIISCLFDYMFLNLDGIERDKMISTKEMYKKLFWHLFSASNLEKQYFLDISNKHKEELLEVSLEVFQFSMKESKKNISKIGWNLIELYKKLNLYNSDDLDKLICNMKEEMEDNYTTISKKSKDDMLKLIILDSKNYQFIKTIRGKDIENSNVYLKYLMLMDINQGIDDFIKIKCKDSIKKKEFEELILLMPSLDEKPIYCNRLKDEKIKFILERHFKLCKEYDLGDVNKYSQVKQQYYFSVRKLKSSLENNLEREGLLREMSKSKIEGLSKLSKHYLKKLENLKIENGIYPPQYYKELFDNYKPTEKIFFDYEKLDKDLKEICYELMESRRLIFKENEDTINDRFRGHLRLKGEGYNVLDQSRGGESESSKSLGERDLIIRNKETNITECVIEAFILKNMAKGIIKNHYQKLIKKYDVHGNKKNIVLVYVKTKQFDNLWGKYSLHFPNLKKVENEKANLKIGVTKEGYMEVIHYFINFYSK
ncbi:MAG: hypothetical protein WBG30_10565, partial [Psychrilyobacter sp.]|uniref:NACHT domain-containing protein n=1 Tax=Psychrilyobacter sp. TaxID=2586924 RepID=UPI003C735B8B